MKIHFTAAPLALDELAPILGGETVELTLSGDVRRKITASRKVVDRVLASGATVYGINTGFGKLSREPIAGAQLEQLQVNLLRSHACGVGTPLPPAIVRTMMVLRVRTFATGRSGVRIELVEKLCELLAADLIPCVPMQGSVGASGDLAPLAHLALALIGEGGRCWLRGKEMAVRAALKKAGIAPIALQAKEGISLINGTQLTTAITAQALLRAENLARTADVACALTIEALKGTNKAFDRRIHEARPHPGQLAVARNLHGLIEGSAILASHRDCGRVQDPYSMRCAPQVHGACRDALVEARRVLAIEINASTDNPLVFAEEGDLISGGNFHAQPIAATADRIAAAVADLASISERRTENLVNPDLSGLPAFLTPKPGLNSGFMIPQVVAAALVSESKSLSFPAAVDSIPTSANKEDHVSMGPIAARKALQIVENSERVVAIELLCAAQGLDFETEHATTRPLAAAHARIRRDVKTLADDRYLAPDLEALAAMVRSGELVAAAHKAGGSVE
ncbi:MAG: histidine ammonia-lyase [Myxococcales bacterium]|nr:histidine ammonia-lyase [Myxococcales bacterium]